MRELIFGALMVVYFGVGLGIGTTVQNRNERCGDGTFNDMGVLGVTIGWPLALIAGGTAMALGWESTKEWRC